jgi:hypothetical protein
VPKVEYDKCVKIKYKNSSHKYNRCHDCDNIERKGKDKLWLAGKSLFLIFALEFEFEDKEVRREGKGREKNEGVMETFTSKNKK